MSVNYILYQLTLKENFLHCAIIDTKQFLEYKKYFLSKVKEYNLEYIKGAIIGEAEIVDCILVDKNFDNSLKKENSIVYESNHVGLYAWKLENIKKYKEPIYVKGKLSLWEYKNYLKFKFIIDDIKKKYAEKEQNKNAYAQTQKEIQTRESKLVKLNAKINGTGLFKKPNEKLNTEANNLILEIKQLYIELDRNKIKEKIFQEINENSTVFDALKLASSYYTYVYYCIQDNIKEITEEEIEQLIKELREFANWPYYTILDNITLLNEKDVMVIIKDRYQLLKINITKEDLDKDNLDGVIDALEKIKMNQNLLKNNINIDELESECEFGKILKSK